MQRVADLILRTGRGPLRPLWAAAHRGLLALAARLVPKGGTLYVRGSFASGEEVLGISDLDLVVITPAGGRPAAQQRAGRIDRVPGLRDLLAVKVYEQAELRDAIAHDLLTAPHALLGPGALHISLRTRPEPGGAAVGWRRLHGPEVRPAPRPQTEVQRCVAAWLELQCWW